MIRISCFLSASFVASSGPRPLRLSGCSAASEEEFIDTLMGGGVSAQLNNQKVQLPSSAPQSSNAQPQLHKCQNYARNPRSTVASTSEIPLWSSERRLLPSKEANVNCFVYVRAVNGLGVGAPSSLMWQCCICKQLNEISAARCRKCNSAAENSHRLHFPPSRNIALFPSVWVCDQCSNLNKTSDCERSNEQRALRKKFFCSLCQAPFQGVQKWTCPLCHSVNSRGSVQCSMCFHERPTSWACASCGKNPISIFTIQCPSCNTKRESVNTSATQQCRFCGTTNDIRSELCEICVAPLKGLESFFEASKVLETQPKSFGAAESFNDPNRSSPLVSSGENSSKNSVPRSTSGTASGASTPPDGSWCCPNCNILLRRNATFCDVCLHSRGGMNSAPSPRQSVPGEWQCPYCRQFQKAEVTECCGKSRKAPAGYWLCPDCSSTNGNKRQICVGCGRPPPAKAWDCAACGKSNSTNVFFCGTCASPHPLLWRCPTCCRSNHYMCDKCDCGAARSPNPEPSVCPVCEAPNANHRTSCFRCKAKLHSDLWKCASCKNDANHRKDNRCRTCLAPRTYNMDEVTWVCDLCGISVATGGDLPERYQCPKCNSLYTPRCLKIPSRWACPQCKLINKATIPYCLECGCKRLLRSFRCPVTCSHCFSDAILDEKESCPQCGESVSDLITAAGDAVQEGAATSWLLGTRDEDTDFTV